MSELSEHRIRAAQRAMRARARTARTAATSKTNSIPQSAALRGKARGYLEAADILESLIRTNNIRHKYDERWLA